MEERAKFTVYKILVKKTPEESWVVFRRYTDFSRLNDKVSTLIKSQTAFLVVSYLPVLLLLYL
jgi:hypothetical protein